MHNMNSKPRNSNNNIKFDNQNKRYERILVCVTQQKHCERLISKAEQIGKPFNSTINVLHVAKENYNFLNGNSDSEALEYLFTISKAIGANLSVIKSNNTIEAIARYAKDNKIDCIIVGKSPKDNNKLTFIDLLRNELTDINIILI